MATKKKTQKEEQPLPCVYGCGNPSEGTLSVNFNEHRSDHDKYRHERGFSAYLPACKACVRGAVKIQVTIPKGRS